MKVLVQELKCPGHHLPYALDQVNRHVEGGNKVVLALNGEMRPRLQVLLGDGGLHDSISVHWVDGIETHWNPRVERRVARREVDTCNQLIKEHQIDRVVLPSADAVALRLIPDVRRARSIGANDVPWDLIVHNGWATPGAFGKRVDKRILHQTVLSMTAKPNVRLLTPDPYIALGPARRLLSRRVDRCCSFLPHPFASFPVVSQEEARAALQLPREGRLLVVPGAITLRKSIRRLLGAMPSLSGIIDGVLFAGVIGDTCRTLVDQVKDSGGPKLHIIDQFLDSRSFGCAVLSADVVWAVYPGWRGISSVQFLAALCNRRCMVDETHRSGVWAANKGVGCSVLGDSVQRTVQEALESPSPDAEYMRVMNAFTDRDTQRAVLVDDLDIRSLETLHQYAVSS